ncbi:hypothetical protein [Plantibacter sp. CFBP 8804]|uniref:hypothetical protein n=1 Tax=Plantibacter sp. CFBP 8804 TaxID=2775270 RepID=UPI00177DF425|nr:hypothetical protein [Plantibacter sp. CFBP 8804]MBD8516392.1 hypothetical protein [Plantibacter sp. CFBP 8804]
MNSETLVLLAVSVLVAGSCALLFVVDSRRSLSGRYINLWLTASMLAVLCTASYLAATGLGHPSLVVALGNGAMVGAVGFVWLGCQAFNGRRIRFWLVVTVVLIVMILTFLPESRGPNWAGVVPKLLSLSLFAVLTAVESRRGLFGSFRVSWAMTIVHALHASYSGARAVVFGLQGPRGGVFERYFNTEITTVINLVFVVVTTLVLVFLRIEELSSRRASGGPGCFTTVRRLWALHRDHPGSVVHSIEIVDLTVVKDAYGVAHANDLVSRLIDSVVQSSSGAQAVASTRRGTVLLLLPDGHGSVEAKVDAAIEDAYWKQSVALVDGYASTLRITTL